MNSVSLNSQSLTFQRFTPPGCKDIGIIKAEFVAKTQFLSMFKQHYLQIAFHSHHVCRVSNQNSVAQNHAKLRQFTGVACPGVFFFAPDPINFF